MTLTLAAPAPVAPPSRLAHGSTRSWRFGTRRTSTGPGSPIGSSDPNES